MKKTIVAIAALALLAGCSANAGLSTISLQSQSERIPSESEINELSLQSPERLCENAPDEPGVNFKFGPKPPAEDLGNFGKLEDSLFRGARPTEKGIEKLAGLGVKLIVSLENSGPVVRQEEAWAKKYGLRFVSLPFGIILPPSEAGVNKFLALAKDPENRPLYFHCMQGRDRTGCMAFTYRVSQQGWNYAEAYAEMVKYKFHTYLLGLRYFLKEYASEHKPAVKQSYAY
ncbi:MAG TPA: tyrosine-protein phosphatase [Chroococcales cyanobacterium]